MLIFLSSCINLNSQLKKEEYKDKKVLYSQKIEGNKEVKTYLLEEYYKQKPNRKLFTQQLTPYWGIYVFGEKWHDTLRISKKRNSIKVKYDQKIKNVSTKIYEQQKTLQNFDRKSKEGKKVIKKINKLQDKEEKFLKLKNKKVDKKTLAIKKGNWLMRVVGEPLAVFDTAAHNRTAREMTSYLNQNGYYNAKVKKNITIKKKKVYVTYNIIEGPIHTIDSVNYIIKDSILKNIVVNHQNNKTLKKDHSFKINDLTNERDQIYTLLRNQGYFHFKRQFISFEVDTNQSHLKTNIDVIISNPQKKEIHKQYSLKNIYVLMDINHQKEVDTSSFRFENKEGKFEEIHFIHKKGEDKIPEKNLFEIILLKQGDLYSLEKTRQTQQYLADVDIFKFININYQELEDTSNLLNAYIYTSSFKKYQITSEAGVNVNVDEGQALPGPFFNVKFKDRKVFKGLEVFESNIRYSLQSQLDFANATDIISNQIIGANISLLFPRLFFPSVLLFGKNKQELYRYFPRTRMSLGYSENNNENYFHRTISEFATNYIFRINTYSRLTINLLSVNVLNTKNITAFFQESLDELAAKGSTLNQSFKSGIITSSQISYTFNNNDLSKNIKAKYYRFLSEIGYSFSKTGELFGLPHYQYFKLNADIRHYLPLSKKSTFALRMNTGFIQMYGNTTVLPFEKYFFIGGVNSIRAWQARVLGPGAYVQDDPTNLLQQPGEVIIESNFEVRRQLAGVIHGALFLDAGNIWTLKSEEARPNSAFDISTIHKTMAIGSGFGLRFDFSFLIIRLDLGIKLWDPALQHWVINDAKNVNFITNLKDSNDYTKIYTIGFGIGYPF